MNSARFISLIAHAFMKAQAIEDADSRETALTALSHRLQAIESRAHARACRTVEYALTQRPFSELFDALQRADRRTKQYESHADVRGAAKAVEMIAWNNALELALKHAERHCEP